MVENSEYAAFVRRILRAMSRRAGWDVDALPMLLELRDQLDEAMRDAVASCRADGYSWGEIAQRLGTTRQAAQQRYGTTSPGTPADRQARLDAEIPFTTEGDETP